MTENIYPKRSLSQNFLIDENIVKKIVNSANIDSNDIVLEIGPGRGALTKILYNLSNKLILIEKDVELCELLKENFHNAEILNEDFLKSNRIRRCPKRIKVIGNLPYNVSTQIIFKIFEEHTFVESAVFMLQKEVADRIVSCCNDKNYSLLTVICSSFGNPFKLFNVSPSCFRPKPKVTSTVVKFEIFDKYNIKNFSHFFLFVKSMFHVKRKKLINCLKKNPFINFSDEFTNELENRYGENIRISEIPVENIVDIYKNLFIPLQGNTAPLSNFQTEG